MHDQEVAIGGESSSAQPAVAKTHPVRRTAILVCGMHRSGTSALTRMLNFLGASLPADIYPPGPGNELGHWEPADSGPLHDAMLASMGTHWISMVPGTNDWLKSPTADHFRERLRALIIRQYHCTPLFVVKDPRISLFLPMWIDVLSELNVVPKIVIAFRNPLEVAQSLAHRHRSSTRDDAWHVDRGGLLWLRYVIAGEQDSRNVQRAFCDYSEIMTDWRTAAKRLGDQLGLSWPSWSPSIEIQIDRFLTGEMRHHESHEALPSIGQIWREWIAPLYEELGYASVSQAVDQAKFDTVSTELAKCLDKFGRYFAAVESKMAMLSSVESENNDLQAHLTDANKQINLVRKELETVVADRDESHFRFEKAQKEIGLLNNKLESTVIDRNDAWSRLEKAHREIDLAKVELDKLAVEYDAADSRADALAHQLLLATSWNDQLEASWASVQAEKQEFVRLADQMRYSFSWRMTTPIRSLRCRFPKTAHAVYRALRKARRLVKAIT